MTAAAAEDIVTVGEMSRRLVADFADAGIDNPRLDAWLLVRAALAAAGAPVSAMPDPALELAPDARARLEILAERRRGREPMSAILGEREFWSLPFRVTRDTLAPRPDSETLVEGVLAAAREMERPDGRELRMLDLGTGTGCLLLAILHELPDAAGVGTDLSAPALAVASANANALGLAARTRFIHGNWADGVEGPFDVILCNPPYIADGDFANLEPEVRDHEPRLALAGGTDGLDAYRAITPALPALLAPGGIAAFETGRGQAPAVAAMLSALDFKVVDILRDLSEIERCVLATVLKV